MPRPALAADRAVQVIELLSLHPTERFNLTEIARRTGINSASAHALLSVLLQSGYVQRHPAHKTYALGPALVAAGNSALEQLPGIRAAQDEIDELSRELQLEALVTTMTDREIIVVGRAPHASAYGAAMIVGQRIAVAPPLGTVFVAWSNPARVKWWLGRAHPALSAAEAESQRQGLAVVRARGYSIAFESEARRGIGQALQRQATGSDGDVNDTIGEMIAELAHSTYHLTALDPDARYDVSMIAAPVFDSNREVTASIAVSGFAPDIAGRDLARIGEHILGVARVVTKRTKGRMPPELE
jgi:DNA-binding IclR family transcriptional regulator